MECRDICDVAEKALSAIVLSCAQLCAAMCLVVRNLVGGGGAI